MNRSNIRIFGILLLALAGGCATATQPVQSPTQVTYTKASAYTYQYNARNDSDMVDNTVATDTITSTVIATDTVYMGMSNVSVLRNVHSNGSNADTTYISQDTASFWHYNYGIESLNNNQKVLNAVGSPIQMGWVLQAKFNAAAGATWVAADNENLRILTFATSVKISAVEQSDTSITVQGTLVPAKHVTHTVTLSAAALGVSLVTTADTYVATSVGVTLNIVHTANVDIPSFYSGPVVGSESLMVRHS